MGRHYFARNMTLAVRSLQPLDTLQAWAEDSFGAAPAGRGLERETFRHLGDPYPAAAADGGRGSRFRGLFKVSPVQDVREVELTWSMPPVKQHFRSNPLDYLTWNIGHEGGLLIWYASY